MAVNPVEHDHAADTAVLLADLKAEAGFRYLDLQRVESAAAALGRWPLLRRIEARLRAVVAGQPLP